MEKLDNTNLKRLERLLNDPAVNVNFRVKQETNTPLLLICHRNKSDSLLPALKLLVKHPKIDLDVRDPEGYTPLMVLCRHSTYKNPVECVKLLIECRNNVEEVEKSGRTALMLLCQFRTDTNLGPVASLLVSHSKDLDKAMKCCEILKQRKRQEESKQLEHFIRTTRVIRNRVSFNHLVIN